MLPTSFLLLCTYWRGGLWFIKKNILHNKLNKQFEYENTRKLYVNDTVQAVSCDLLLYADDTGLIFQQKDINIREHQVNRNFSIIWNWFVDNKLSIHLALDKTKSILFVPLNKYKKLRKLNISYSSLKFKQYSEVIYLGCVLDESLSRESMALNVVSKINTRLTLLYRKYKLLSPY